IVADNAGSADTKRLVGKWSTNIGPALRYVPAANPRGPAAARNAGWRAANGEVIAFTDDDCIPEPGWLLAGIAALQDDIVAAGGAVPHALLHPPPPFPVKLACTKGL